MKLFSKLLFLGFLVFILICCQVGGSNSNPVQKKISLVILGTIQDAGSPQAGCQKDCCKDLWDNPVHDRKIVSLGLIDHATGKNWMFEASPDFKSQAASLANFAGKPINKMPDGIFLTHAHIGHYTGLMFLGHESIGAKEVPVFTMPKMKSYLESNGPWSQLVTLKNIILNPLDNNIAVTLTEGVSVTPFQVPHRDEYSETVGFLIKTPRKKVMFIPDIDKWNKWEKDIIEEIAKVDYAIVDGTFYANGEIPNRDMSLIPHPFVEESMQHFKNLDATEKAKVHFIHFNHTNPLIDPESKAFKDLHDSGFKIARFHQQFEL